MPTPPPIPHTLSEHPCIDFCNSLFADHRGSGEVYDRFHRSEWWTWYLERAELGPSPGGAVPLGRLRAARSQIRDCLEAVGSLSPAQLTNLNRLMALAPGVTRLVPGPGLVFQPLRHSWDWVIAATARSAAEVIASGAGQRVRVCANPACSFMFVDTSHNRWRRWCDTSLCGNLVKVRRFRARSRPAPAV